MFDSEFSSGSCPCGCRGNRELHETFESGLTGEVWRQRRVPRRPSPRVGAARPAAPRPRPRPGRRGPGRVYVREPYPVAYPFEPEPGPGPSEEPGSESNRWVQDYKGLTPDGIVGPQTEAALMAAGAAPPPQTSRAPAGTIPSGAGTPDIVSVRGIQVARKIAPQVEALLAAAEGEGVRLSGWGYRSTARQIELRKQHCGTSDYDIYQKPASQCTPPTAPPGRSMHEQGLAIDFTYNGAGIPTQSNPGFQWLARNAVRFGLYNLPSEPWHWSVNGK